VAGPAQFTRALLVYSRTAWWGLVAPRLIEREPLVVAQAVIVRESNGTAEILLSVRSDVKGWELPGGTPEPGETIQQALVREVREETGLDVAVTGHVGDYVRTGFRPHTAQVYACRVIGGRLQSSRETPVVRWFDTNRLPDTLFPWYREPIADSFAGRAEPVQRLEHQGLGAIWAGIRTDVKMRWRHRGTGGDR
jgi:8-oxo-dGTP pyrophosphatase MutT (NUDIX family)